MFTSQVLGTISKYNMFSKGDRIVVGVSGGPDSLALLLFLNELKKDMKLKLFVVSLNHMFRKKEAQEDVMFVKGLAKRLRLAFYAQRIDLPKLHNIKGGSKEDLARQARYEFFAKAAKNFGAKEIALGHTRDDQAETVLMRLIYGAGITGLSGIPPTRKLGPYLIIRPLIETSRADIDLYLKENGIKACSDATNYDNAYKRNKIRNRLLPFLEKQFNPNIKEGLSRTAALLRDDKELLEEVLLKEVFGKLIKPAKGKIIYLNLKKFDRLHIALKKYVLRECIRKVNLRLAGIEYRHWRLLEAFIAKRKDNTYWYLPYGCRVKMKKGSILFYNERTVI